MARGAFHSRSTVRDGVAKTRNRGYGPWNTQGERTTPPIKTPQIAINEYRINKLGILGQAARDPLTRWSAIHILNGDQ